MAKKQEWAFWKIVVSSLSLKIFHNGSANLCRHA